MKKLAFATAALAALAFTVPAFAQDVKVRIGEGDHHRHMMRHMERHEMRMHRRHEMREGWRHRHHDHGKVVIIKKREG
jgi:hypothetical protein